MEWVSWVFRWSVGEGFEGGLGWDLGPEVFEGGVDEAAAFGGGEAEGDGFEGGGVEAELGEGAEAAGSLGLQDGCAALEDAVGRWRDGVPSSGKDSSWMRGWVGGGAAMWVAVRLKVARVGEGRWLPEADSIA